MDRQPGLARGLPPVVRLKGSAIRVDYTVRMHAAGRFVPFADDTVSVHVRGGVSSLRRVEVAIELGAIVPPPLRGFGPEMKIWPIRP